MALTTIKNMPISEVAEHIYEEQKELLATRTQKSIDVGMAQIENGEYMSLAESKSRIEQKYFTNLRAILNINNSINDLEFENFKSLKLCER